MPLGTYAINPVNGERIPIWIADYVLVGYGTGAIMAVPAHDERDFEFARKLGLPVRRVVAAPGTVGGSSRWRPRYVAHSAGRGAGQLGRLHAACRPYEGGTADRRRRWRQRGTGQGRRDVSAARLADQPPAGVGHADPGRLLQEIRRRHRAGARRPDCRCCCPTSSSSSPQGGNPLSRRRELREHDLPEVRRLPAKRETDTHGHVRRLGLVLVALPVAAQGRRPDRSAARDASGARSTSTRAAPSTPCMHLLYARFFTKALNDLGLVHEREPWLRLFNQGQILGADGERMSKSRGNVQDPDELVARYGADTVRLFLMFMGPWDQGGPWSPTGIDGVHRFLRRVWTVVAGSART